MCIGAELNGVQQDEAMEVLRRHEKIFTEMLGKTSIIRQRTDLIDDHPIKCKAYPVSYAVQREV